MGNLAVNKRAIFDYQLLDKYEAGIVLTGGEVKSAKAGQCSLKGSFVTVKGGELYVTNASIPRYKLAGTEENYDPTRPRKLLLKKFEIKSLIGKIKTQGLTLVPVSLYTKKRPASTRGDHSSTRGGLIKLEFAIAKGKKKHDKRQDIAKKEAKRSMDRSLKNY